MVNMKSYKEKLNKMQKVEKFKEDCKLKEQNDPDRICGNIWFNGTEEQRKAFSGGTAGRGRDEKPPKKWWDDCVAKVGK
jgi:hypothetical protein